MSQTSFHSSSGTRSVRSNLLNLFVTFKSYKEQQGLKTNLPQCQYKEIEKKNRMGKTRDLFKKIRDSKGTFHTKVGTIKDRNGMDLTEAEDIKKLQEYTEELTKRDLHDQDNDDGMIIHLEPAILECEVKGALESITTIKASEVLEIQLSSFKS